MPSPDTRVLTAHVPAQLASQVERIAARLDRSRGWVVKQALAAWVHREEERQRLTLEALTDVDAGRTVDQAEVDAWAQSLSTEHPKPLPPCA
jgi:predicted transcriptional regulator